MPAATRPAREADGRRVLSLDRASLNSDVPLDDRKYVHAHALPYPVVLKDTESPLRQSSSKDP